MRAGGRTWLLLPAGASLLGGVDAGLVLLGAPAPVSDTRLGDIHGPLMVLGFLGTLIALERASALRSPWGYAAPALLGLGGLALLAPVPRTLGQVLLLDGAMLLLMVLGSLRSTMRAYARAVTVIGGVSLQGVSAGGAISARARRCRRSPASGCRPARTWRRAPCPRASGAPCRCRAVLR